MPRRTSTEETEQPEMAHDHTPIHQHTQFGEMVCKTHWCAECDPDYVIGAGNGGTDDNQCGMNMGFPKQIPRPRLMEAYLKAHNKEIEIGDVGVEFTLTNLCSECKATHECTVQLVYTGKSGAPYRDHAFEVRCT